MQYYWSLSMLVSSFIQEDSLNFLGGQTLGFNQIEAEVYRGNSRNHCVDGEREGKAESFQEEWEDKHCHKVSEPVHYSADAVGPGRQHFPVVNPTHWTNAYFEEHQVEHNHHNRRHRPEGVYENVEDYDSSHCHENPSIPPDHQFLATHHTNQWENQH